MNDIFQKCLNWQSLTYYQNDFIGFCFGNTEYISKYSLQFTVKIFFVFSLVRTCYQCSIDTIFIIDRASQHISCCVLMTRLGWVCKLPIRFLTHFFFYYIGPWVKRKLRQFCLTQHIVAILLSWDLLMSWNNIKETFCKLQVSCAEELGHRQQQCTIVLV